VNLNADIGEGAGERLVGARELAGHRLRFSRLPLERECLLLDRRGLSAELGSVLFEPPCLSGKYFSLLSHQRRLIDVPLSEKREHGGKRE